jgi:hypothetical protein
MVIYFSGWRTRRTRINPQDITRDGGKIYKLNDDGSIPKEQSFVGKSELKISFILTIATQEWQNQLLAIWETEHGPSLKG